MLMLVGTPHAVYVTASGKRYAADDFGMIRADNINDVSDLIDAGAAQSTGARSTSSLATVPPAAGQGQTVMAGLGATITPILTGNALLIIQGTATNSNSSDGGALQLCISANAGELAPAGGQQASGTPLGQALVFGVASAAVKQVPFHVSGYATGMELTRPYWYDLAITGVAGGAASISGVTMIAIEL